MIAPGLQPRQILLQLRQRHRIETGVGLRDDDAVIHEDVQRDALLRGKGLTDGRPQQKQQKKKQRERGYEPARQAFSLLQAHHPPEKAYAARLREIPPGAAEKY